VAIDFEIMEFDGRTTTLTEVMTGRFANFDELVKSSFQQVTVRLAGFGRLAEVLSDQQQKAAPQAG
jgi:hypothetical protein